MTAVGVGVIAGVAVLNSILLTAVARVNATEPRFYVLVLWPYVVATLFAKFVK